MANWAIHILLLGAAIIIPGGLIVYLVWQTSKTKSKQSQKPMPSPDEARKAFEKMFPAGSLRSQSRKKSTRAGQNIST